MTLYLMPYEETLGVSFTIRVKIISEDGEFGLEDLRPSLDFSRNVLVSVDLADTAPNCPLLLEDRLTLHQKT
jgi:hypothetical protein